MYTRILGTIFSAALGLFILGACGDLGTVLPSTGTYQVSALINEYSLDEYSVISQNDRVRPFFINSIINDPDVRGLTVFLQSPLGNLSGGKVKYTLEAAETNGFFETPGESSGEEAEEPEQFEEETPAASLMADQEEFPPEDGTALTDNPVLDPQAADQIIAVTRIDQELPAFSLSENLEIGRYVMVFQVLGEREVLYRIQKPFFFLGDADFTIGDIQSYLPNFTAGSHFVPPGSNIMLEAQVAADERLSPYVIWYNGRRRIGEGFLADGVNRFIWTVPEQNGFQIVRVEVFPFRPIQNIKGKSKELSIPVSSRYENTGFFASSAEQFIHWYQFRGDLKDSKAPGDSARDLRPKARQISRWRSAGGIYGLSVGPNDMYLLPGFPFTTAPQELGNGQLMARFKPLKEGSILKSSFKTENSSITNAELELVYIKEPQGQDILSLSISSETEFYEKRLPFESLNPDDFISVIIDFTIRETSLSAGFTFTEIDPGDEPQTIALSGPLRNGTFLFGGPLPERYVQERDDPPEEADQEDENTVIGIFDELAILYAVEPLPDLELPQETSPLD
jgi:hypothetical protein